MLELSIDSIRVSLMNYQRVVILKEKESERCLPIWVGPAEADSIAVKLQEVVVPRPLTHDLLGNMVIALGGSVSHIIVNDLENDTFYAKIVLKINGNVVEVDCRPSDAIALAVRIKAPIFAEDAVLAQAGIFMDSETGKPLIENEAGFGKSVPQLKDEELRAMSAFSEFIEGLNLEDLDTENKETS
jgi:bifunctional DNase/RNase